MSNGESESAAAHVSGSPLACPLPPLLSPLCPADFVAVADG